MSYRKPVIRIELDQWDWIRGNRINKQPIDVTEFILSYSFSESIKNPAGQGSFTVLPQMDGVNVLDVLNTMDVIRVFEFDVLKYQGYVVRVAYSGMMQQTEPKRSCIVSTKAMGSLISESKIGLNIGIIVGQATALANASIKLNLAIGNAVKDGVTFAEIITIVIDQWFILIDSLGGTTYTEYITSYLDFTTGLTAKNTPSTPKTMQLYNGNEESLTLWGLLQQLVEEPLNELWFTTGKQTVRINNKDVALPDAKTYLVLRETPFDGTVGGESSTYWTDMPSVYVDLDHLTRFDLSKSMEEAFTLFGAVPSAFDPGNIQRVLLGQTVYDAVKLGKYLYRPLIAQLKFTRIQTVDETAIEKSSNEFSTIIKNVSETLKAWFVNNDEYLSGIISLQVPMKSDDDPRIGSKLEAEGITGQFYVESIAHQWSYGGNIVSNLTVTRGYDYQKMITLKDKLFTRSII